MTKVLVLSDSFGRMEPSPATRSGFEHVTYYKGAELDLEGAELERALGLGAVGSADELVAQVVAAGEGPTWADEQLEASTVGDIVAYLGQHPSELDRVETLERARGGKGPRKGVTDVIAEIRDAQAELARAEAEAQADLERDAQATAAAAAIAGGAPTIPASATS